MRLTGKAVTDYSNASLIGIAFDIVNRKWDTGLLEEMGMGPAKFPDPYPCDEIIGEVTREAAGVGVGLYRDYDVVKQWVKHGEKHTPIAKNAALYDRLYPVYRNLYPQVQSSFRDVAQALHG